ncbi:hypothetical protein TrST_g9132 [Triparma strigata]|uniref:Phytanoyl-CoA dioxygenase n=1 Tax=Triparma strigata TaxID=1606541 RepID=A0A9W7C4E3_9STRA|nr:hypothetical protein TrST_g9132 [Triparma strigata]
MLRLKILTVLAFVVTLVTPFTNVFPRFSLQSDMNEAKKSRALIEEAMLSRPEQVEGEGSTWTSCKPVKRRGGRGAQSKGGGFGGGGAGLNMNKNKSKNKQQTIPLTSPKLSVKEGSRFGVELAREGFVRINGALSPSAAEKLREEVLAVQANVAVACAETSLDPESVYGTEPGRTSRIDLLLPFDTEVQASMDELFVSGGPLRSLFEEVVGAEGEFYEMAAIITSSGADRQIIHPDLPWRNEAPLYVCFCALQDCTLAMGPTTFLPKSNDLQTRQIYDAGGDGVDAMLSASEVATPCLLAGDLVIFDARTLHAGCANTDDETTRCLYNFSFRTTSFLGDLGYKGSMRSGYSGKLNLGDVMNSADAGGQKLGGELGDGLGGG